MISLRIRITALAAMIAIFSVSVSALAGVYSARRSVRDQQSSTAQLVLGDVRKQLRQLIDTVAFEVREYAVWDELYEQMPQPSSAWADINLRPGKDNGQVCQEFVLLSTTGLIGRYRAGAQQSVPDDAATVAALGHMGKRAPSSGIALVHGTPVLWSAQEIRRSDGTGDSTEVLIGLASINSKVRERFYLNGWSLAFSPTDEKSRGPTVTLIGSQTNVSCIEPAGDGGLRITVAEQSNGGDVIVYNANKAIIIAGVITALLATLVGVILGFYWLRPIHHLAEACRRRTRDSGHVLPVDQTLTEAAVLGTALKELIDAEQVHHHELMAVLDRERTTSAVQRRFLSQLGQEFGVPIRQLINSIDRLAQHNGRLPPDEVVAIQHTVQLLEERFHEVLGLTAGDDSFGASSEHTLIEYLSGIAELLRPVATRRGVELQVGASDERVLLDTRLFTPVLVNVVANAIAATTHGRVEITARPGANGGTCWTVSDTGSGLPSAVAAEIENIANHRGSAIGVAGLGLGLTLVLANLQALGGRMTIRSSGPAGTVLQIDLPAHQSASARLQLMQTPGRPVRYTG